MVRGIFSGTTLTLGLSLQRRERRPARSDEAHFWGTKYFRIRANDAARRPGLREFSAGPRQRAGDPKIKLGLSEVRHPILGVKPVFI